VVSTFEAYLYTGEVEAYFDSSMEVLSKKLRYPALSLSLDDNNDEGVVGTT